MVSSRTSFGRRHLALAAWSWLGIACGGLSSDPSAPVAPLAMSASPTPDAPSHAVLLPTFVCSEDVCLTAQTVATFQLPDWPVDMINVTRVGPTESLPMVVRGASRVVLDLTTTPGETATRGWVTAMLLADNRTIVGVIDNVVESPGNELTVASSKDGGETWRRGATIPKPHYMATVRELKAQSPTRWTLTVDLADCADCGVPTGTYTATTDDAGVTFTKLVRTQ